MLSSRQRYVPVRLAAQESSADMHGRTCASVIRGQGSAATERQTRFAITRAPCAGCSRVGQDVEAIATATALKALRLDTCGLSDFPAAAVTGLPHLTALTLDNNAIPVLPVPPLAALAALEELHVRNNALTALPPQLALLPRLRTLQVEGNMLRTIRRSVLDRGSPALLQYLHSRLPL